MAIYEAHTLQPGVEEGFTTESTLTSLGKHVTHVGIVSDSSAEIRPPTRLNHNS